MRRFIVEDLRKMHNRIKVFPITNRNGLRADITNFGARMMSLLVPDRDGILRDVVQGFDRVEEYFPEKHLSDFGACIGRYANRLKNGRISIEGLSCQLPQNNGPHCLHGGPDGWQYRVFDVLEYGDSHLVLRLVSPDGDNGFPGTVTAQVTYTLTDDNALDIQYEAVTDQTTVINLTNHSYFNLNGDATSSVLDHFLQIDADRFLPIDETFIPTGEIRPVAGTPFDFRISKSVGRDFDLSVEQLRYGNGYDHNWLLNTCGDDKRACARLESPHSGIVMELFTTAPGMQVYTGNFLDGSVMGKGGCRYPQRSAICLETQFYPDSPNHSWPESSGYLRAGEIFYSITKYQFHMSGGL